MEDALVAYRLQQKTQRRPAGSANRTRMR
jgi:hypothetical protein